MSKPNTDDVLRWANIFLTEVGIDRLRREKDVYVTLSDLLALAHPAFKAGMLRAAEIAQEFPTKHGFHSCFSVADAIRAEAEKP